MIQRGLWQEQAVQDIARLLEADADVCALFVTGSSARAQGSPDTWSDIDAVVQRHPLLEWIDYARESLTQ